MKASKFQEKRPTMNLLKRKIFCCFFFNDSFVGRAAFKKAHMKNSSDESDSKNNVL